MTQNSATGVIENQLWLMKYYFVRAIFSIAWVVGALTIGRQSVGIGAGLLIIYPLWDAVANYVDGKTNGGLANNRSQAVNVFVSLVMTGAVIVALTVSINWVLVLFGFWAIFAGILQLGAAVRRWTNNGGQWAMVLSGAQSMVAGAFFIFQAGTQVEPSIAGIAGYAGFGAFYFLLSAIWICIRQMRGKSI